MIEKIEIITTKKKLSKAFINQMHKATEHIMITGKCLGYVLNVKKNAHELAIIEHENDYYTEALNYKLSSSPTKIYRKCGSGIGSYNYSFETIKEREIWWEGYTKMKKIALKTHIYI